jgi:hypothetical protein
MTEIELEIDAMNAAMEEIQKRAAVVKSNFEKCINNPALSLDLRWNLFMRAPSSLKNEEGWIVHFPGGVDDLIGYDGPIWADRHQTVDIEQIMNCLDNPDAYDIDMDKIDVVAFKEYVLNHNLGSYTYDW